MLALLLCIVSLAFDCLMNACDGDNPWHVLVRFVPVLGVDSLLPCTGATINKPYTLAATEQCTSYS